MPDLWNFGDIQTEVRQICQRKSSYQISDENLKKEINRYYFFKFPLDVKPLELLDWWEFDTVASQTRYTIPQDEVVTLLNPAYVEGYPLEMVYNRQYFYRRFPETTTDYTEMRPQYCLFDGTSVVLMNPPDAVYSVKISAFVRPMTLSASSDKPTLEAWGPILVTGTALEIVKKYGDAQRIAELEALHDERIAEVQSNVAQQLTDVRSIPRF